MNKDHLLNLTNLLRFAALLEITTGFVLMIFPSLVAQLLLNTELIGPSIAVGRVAGFGLFTLGIACWPSQEISKQNNPALWAIFIYNILIATYLIFLGINGLWVGWVLWPAALLHTCLTIMIFKEWKWNIDWL